MRAVAHDTSTVSDVHATTIDVYPDVEEVSAEIETSEPPTENAPVSDEALEARLIYETRAIAERRLAVARAEDDKPTKRVEALALRGLDRSGTLMGMSPPPPPEPTPVPGPIPTAMPVPMPTPMVVTPDESSSVTADRSSMMHTARVRARRSRVVRVLATLAFLGLATWFVMLLERHDPGFVHTREAIARFVRTMLS